MTKHECCMGKSETRGNFPPLVRAVALAGDGGLANLLEANAAHFSEVSLKLKFRGKHDHPWKGCKCVVKVEHLARCILRICEAGYYSENNLIPQCR